MALDLVGDRAEATTLKTADSPVRMAGEGRKRAICGARRVFVYSVTGSDWRLGAPRQIDDECLKRG